MIVTKIEPRRRDRRRVNLYLDGALALSLHRDILDRHNVAEGFELPPALLETLKNLEEIALAEQHALRLLAYRLRSAHELRGRLLQEEFAPAAVDATIDRLRNVGYIDDERFARSYIHDRLLKRSVGRMRLANELRRKGLPAPLVAAVLDEEVTASDEVRRAEAEGAKALHRYRQRDDERKRRDRLTRFLMSRGFGWDAVSTAVRHLLGAD